MEPIDKLIKRITGDTPKGNSPSTSTIKPLRSPELRGDPNCPICGGIGFVRKDVPISHPDFGRVDICECRQKEVLQSAFARIYRMSNLDAFRNMTFESFNTEGLVGEHDGQTNSLTMALNTAQYFAQHLDGWLLLMGSFGVGKTHLAASIANFTVSLNVPTLFLTVSDLLDWLRYSFSGQDQSFEERFEEIRNVRLLVMDDLGTQNTTPWAEEKLYQILNHRYVNRLPTVITTNQALDEIEGRIQSRLRDPELVRSINIEARDHRNPSENSARRPLSSLEYYRDQTFGNFSMREPENLSPAEHNSLEMAFRAARTFAENPRGWVVFTGPYGCGKTHLAAAIANYCAGVAGRPPLFEVVSDLLDHLRSTFAPNSLITYDEVFEQVRSAHLLILDDLGMQSASPWAREKLYQILNHRSVVDLPTVITTADPIEKLDGRISSRMLDSRKCQIYAITAPAFRGIVVGLDRPRRSRASGKANG